MELNQAESFGTLLRRYRELAGLSQQALAEHHQQLSLLARPASAARLDRPAAERERAPDAGEPAPRHLTLRALPLPPNSLIGRSDEQDALQWLGPRQC